VNDKVNKLRFGQVNLLKQVTKRKWVNALHCRLIVKAILQNPSIDKEGKTLYFASNMPGSLGGTDLWKVTVNADGTFGIPENLGNSINTAG
jgi:hypothetical protein